MAAGCVLYIIILFSNCIEAYIPFGNYLDEFIFLMLLLLVLTKICVFRTDLDGWNRYDCFLMIGILLFFFVGSVSTLLNSKNVEGAAVIKDVVLSGKFFLVFLSGRLLFITGNREELFRRMRTVTKFVITIIFICGVVSLFFNIGMGEQIRFGLRSYQFIFTHYTFLVYAETVMIAVLYTERAKTEKKYFVMAVISMLFTLRTKAVVFCIVLLLFYVLDKMQGRLRLRYYVIAGAAGIAVAWGKIEQYLSWGFSYNMRNGLYLTGLKLAAEYFPFGTGFAGFGSNLSYEYNPQIYYDLGLGSYQGFENGAPVLSDVFWPYVMGEFGMSGMLLYIVMLVFIFFSLKEELKDQPGMFQGANCIFAYLLVASMAEAVFTNSSGVLSAVMLSMYFRRTREIKGNILSPFIVRF